HSTPASNRNAARPMRISRWKKARVISSTCLVAPTHLRSSLWRLPAPRSPVLQRSSLIEPYSCLPANLLNRSALTQPGPIPVVQPTPDRDNDLCLAAAQAAQ